jgi:hypothetical protein
MGRCIRSYDLECEATNGVVQCNAANTSLQICPQHMQPDWRVSDYLRAYY